MRHTGYTYPNKLNPRVWIQLVMTTKGLEPTFSSSSAGNGGGGIVVALLGSPFLHFIYNDRRLERFCQNSRAEKWAVKLTADRRKAERSSSGIPTEIARSEVSQPERWGRYQRHITIRLPDGGVNGVLARCSCIHSLILLLSFTSFIISIRQACLIGITLRAVDSPDPLGVWLWMAA